MRRVPIGLTSRLAAMLVLILGSVVSQAQDRPGKTARVVSPWFVYQGEHSIDLLKPNADMISSISVCGGCPREFVDQCHALDITVYLLKGGHDGRVFETPAARHKLIQSYLDQCRMTGADGIDLNFESLDKRYLNSYSDLLREASRAFRAADKRLSMCVSYLMCTWRTADGPKPGSADIDGGWFDPAVVGKTCDMVRVMCYDMHSVSGGGIGPVSTCPWARDAMRFWMRHVPREKLVMGLPAYSRDFAMTGKRQVESVYAPTPKVAADTSLVRVWLPYEELAQYRYTGPDGIVHLFYASDEASTRAHLKTAAELKLKTIGFWHYAAVTSEQWAAVREWIRSKNQHQTE
jgi:spore germination protein YaaH